MTMGTRINYVRKKMKLTQKEFAEDLAISQTHVSKLEKDIEKPSSILIRLISIKYNIVEEWLISGEGNAESGWDMTTDEGATNKYKAMRLSLDDKVKSRTGIDLYNTIEAFAYFEALLTPSNLSGESCSEYIENIKIIMDNLEKLTFHVSKSIHPSKTESEGWIRYRKRCESLINKIDEQIKKTANLYLERFGEHMKL